LRAIRNLTAFAAFRSTPYRRVLIGWIAGDPAHELATAWAARPETFARVVRMTPLEQVVDFAGDDVTETLCCALAGAGERVAGRTFHVRARLRGLTGRVDKQAVDRALGAFLLDLADAAGAAARVSFQDPDVVLAVEVIGKRAGFAFLDRAVRTVPLVRPR
jgi:tRNA(Ser,Leu) C12 N-acetylase TAN1